MRERRRRRGRRGGGRAAAGADRLEPACHGRRRAAARGGGGGGAGFTGLARSVGTSWSRLPCYHVTMSVLYAFGAECRCVRDATAASCTASLHTVSGRSSEHGYMVSTVYLECTCLSERDRQRHRERERERDLVIQLRERGERVCVSWRVCEREEGCIRASSYLNFTGNVCGRAGAPSAQRRARGAFCADMRHATPAVSRSN